MFLYLFIATCILFYLYLKYIYSYWERRGVPYKKPLLIFGNIKEAVLGRKSFGDILKETYDEFEDEPFYGIYRCFTPLLVIKDPELIKDITTEAFEYFMDNDLSIDKKLDPLFGRNPFPLKGEEWKAVKAQLTPCFTSKKMKMVFPLLAEVGERMVKYLNNEIGKNKYVTQEGKDLGSKFTIDNVATSAFGIEGKCFEDPDNEFRDIARKFMSPDSASVKRMNMILFLPILSNLLSVRFVEKEVNDKIIEIVKDTVAYREKNNVSRGDFLDLMIKLKESCKAFKFTDIDVAAHTAGFFIDGYETTSVAISFLCYEVAANPDVQLKSRDEIRSVLQKYNGEITYEALSEMEYVEAVLLEVIRKHPVLRGLIKSCTKSYTYYGEDSRGKKLSLTIEKGTSIILPNHCLGLDSKYHTDPETFMPERFMAHNKGNINKFTSLQFGEGPRMCLGKRFGLLQMKIFIVEILKNFEVRVNPKTITPIQYHPTYVLTLAKGGVWVDFYKLSAEDY